MPTINSSPATFSNSGPPANQALTFAIPAGSYSGAAWNETGTNTVTGVNATDKIYTSGLAHVATFPAKLSAGSFSYAVAATSQQLADINAAAGATLSATFDYNDGTGFGDSISAFTLTLTPAGSVTAPTATTTYAIGYRMTPGPSTPFFPAPLAHTGGGNGIGYVLEGLAGGSVSLSALTNLITSQTLDTVTFQAGFEGAVDFIIEVSSDLMTWSALSLTLSEASSYGGSYSGVSLTPDGSGGYTFIAGSGTYATAWYKAGFTAVSDIYIRLSMTDSASGSNVATVGLLSFWAEHSATILSPPAHGFSGTPAGAGGFMLSGTWCTTPGNLINSGAGPPSNGGLPKTDHPLSNAWLTFIENNPDPGGYYLYPNVVTSVSLVQTDCSGAYSYSASVDLYTLQGTPGRWLPCTYEVWLAYVTGSHGSHDFYPACFQGYGPGWTYGFLGSGDPPPNGFLTASEAPSFQYPIHPDRYTYFQQDLAYPEYFFQFSDGAAYVATNAGFSNGSILDNGFNPFTGFISDLPPADLPPAYGFSVDHSLGGWSAQSNFGQPMTGSWLADFVSEQAPNVAVYQRYDGSWFLLSGATVTLSDSCGQSETVTSNGVPVAPGSFTATTGFLEKVNCLDLATVSINTTGSSRTAISTNGTYPGAYQIYPTIQANEPHASGLASADNYAGLAFGDVVCRPLLWCRAPDASSGGPQVGISADAFESLGILALAWSDSSNKLYLATHPGPLGNIGNGGGGWDATQTMASSSTAGNVGVVYMMDGSLLFVSDATTNPQQVSSRLGRGAWTNVPSNVNNYPGNNIPSGGRGNQETFAIFNGDLTLCQDRIGTVWGAGNGTGLADPFCCYLRNGRYIAVGVVAGTLTAKVSNFPGGSANFTALSTASLTGVLIGLVYTSAGVLVGLLWDQGVSNQFWSLSSYDQGLTWTKGSGLIPVTGIPALTAAPAMAVIGSTVLACWTDSNNPVFAASNDSGRTWA